MKKTVVKFGGSNLKTREDILKLVKVVQIYNRPLVIVISAFYGVTDSLLRVIQQVKIDEDVISEIKKNLLDAHFQMINLYIEDSTVRQIIFNKITKRVEELEKYLLGVHYLGEIPDFVEDMVLCYGEKLSSLVLSSILSFQNIDCQECLPEDIGLYTNGEFRNATVDFNHSQSGVKKALSGDKTYIVPGFYGISQDLKVTLLGRGGSDYSAAALASCLEAESVDLWKDVSGFMTADPKVIENTKVIDRLNYNEAAELSYFGAKILHPRTFEPVIEKKIPIKIFNINSYSEDLKPLTIIEENGVIKKDIIKSVSFSDDFGIIKLHGFGVGIIPGVMAKVTKKLLDARINIKSIITSQIAINILLSIHDLQKSLEIIKQIGLASVDMLTLIDDIAVIAVVGNGVLEQHGIAARIFTAVSNFDINVRTISAGASNVAIYFIIDKKDREKTIKALHQEFFG
jgi:aspartate kinase/aspartokinase/homoserine dehydrogenase 1